MKIGSPVMATDGEFGYLQMVIMDPHQERVVALLVRQYGLITPHTVVVPEDKIADATDREVRLKINLQQVDALPEYKPETGLVVEIQKYEVDDESFAVRGKEGMQSDAHLPRGGPACSKASLFYLKGNARHSNSRPATMFIVEMVTLGRCR
jgi:hypothetical protein